MDIESLKTVKSKEEDGVRVPFGDGWIALRSRSSDFFKKVTQRIFKPYESSIALNVLPDETAKTLVIASMAEGLIVDWGGLTSGGDEVPYSIEKAIEWLNISRFFDFVESNVDKLENFREAKLDAETKNS